jgi:hypothetical protein
MTLVIRWQVPEFFAFVIHQGGIDIVFYQLNISIFIRGYSK